MNARRSSKVIDVEAETVDDISLKQGDKFRALKAEEEAKKQDTTSVSASAQGETAPSSTSNRKGGKKSGGKKGSGRKK